MRQQGLRRKRTSGKSRRYAPRYLHLKSDAVEYLGDIVDQRPGFYYVTVVDAGKVGFLAGPFINHSDALDQVEPARLLADRADPWVHFYAFGTCRLEKPIGDGLFNKNWGWGYEERPCTYRANDRGNRCTVDRQFERDVLIVGTRVWPSNEKFKQIISKI